MSTNEKHNTLAKDELLREALISGRSWSSTATQEELSRLKHYSQTEHAFDTRVHAIHSAATALALAVIGDEDAGRYEADAWWQAAGFNRIPDDDLPNTSRAVRLVKKVRNTGETVSETDQFGRRNRRQRRK